MKSIPSATVLVAIVSVFVTGALHADVITVNPDGSAEYETIQEAVNVASDGDEIQIQPGVYTGTGDQVVDTLGKSIVLRGMPDGTSAPLIDGEGIRRGIICRSGEGPGTVIEELVFRNCYPAWYDWNDNGQPDFWEYFGGAMWCRDGSAPTIRLCVFANNRAEYGGAIYCGDENGVASNPIIVDSLFAFNESAPASGGVGGALYNNASSPVITGSGFVSNQAYSGGAILNWAGSDPEMLDCRFTDNSARNGGAVYNDSSQPRHIGCRFEGNSASADGGAVFNADPSSSLNVPVFESCDFIENSAGSEGGAVNNFSVDPEITMCLFTENTAPDGSALHSWNGSVPKLFGTYICGNGIPQVSGPFEDLGKNRISQSCLVFCPGDLNGDGNVDGTDLTQLLGDWGVSGTKADLDENGTVDGGDLVILLGNWNACP